MGYRGIVKGNIVILEAGITLPDGSEVEVTPVGELQRGSPAALLEVWGSDVPDEVWDCVDRTIEELDHADREYERNNPHASGLPI
jgi:hypothetical protein